MSLTLGLIVKLIELKKFQNSGHLPTEAKPKFAIAELQDQFASEAKIAFPDITTPRASFIQENHYLNLYKYIASEEFNLEKDETVIEGHLRAYELNFAGLNCQALAKIIKAKKELFDGIKRKVASGEIDINNLITADKKKLTKHLNKALSYQNFQVDETLTADLADYLRNSELAFNNPHLNIAEITDSLPENLKTYAAKIKAYFTLNDQEGDYSHAAQQIIKDTIFITHLNGKAVKLNRDLMQNKLMGKAIETHLAPFFPGGYELDIDEIREVYYNSTFMFNQLDDEMVLELLKLHSVIYNKKSYEASFRPPVDLPDSPITDSEIPQYFKKNPDFAKRFQYIDDIIKAISSLFDQSEVEESYISSLSLKYAIMCDSKEDFDQLITEVLDEYQNSAHNSRVINYLKNSNHIHFQLEYLNNISDIRKFYIETTSKFKLDIYQKLSLANLLYNKEFLNLNDEQLSEFIDTLSECEDFEQVETALFKRVFKALLSADQEITAYQREVIKEASNDGAGFEHIKESLSVEVDKEDNLPNYHFEGGDIGLSGFKFEKLSKTDPEYPDRANREILFIGKILGSGCCQRIGGHEHNSLINGLANKNVAWYGIRGKDNKLVAKVYAWLTTNGDIAFDSFEGKNNINLIKFIEKFSAQLAREYPGKKLYLGTGGDTMELSYKKIIQEGDDDDDIKPVDNVLRSNNGHYDFYLISSLPESEFKSEHSDTKNNNPVQLKDFIWLDSKSTLLANILCFKNENFLAKVANFYSQIYSDEVIIYNNYFENMFDALKKNNSALIKFICLVNERDPEYLNIDKNIVSVVNSINSSQLKLNSDNYEIVQNLVFKVAKLYLDKPNSFFRYNDYKYKIKNLNLIKIVFKYFSEEFLKGEFDESIYLACINNFALKSYHSDDIDDIITNVTKYKEVINNSPQKKLVIELLVLYYSDSHKIEDHHQYVFNNYNIEDIIKFYKSFYLDLDDYSALERIINIKFEIEKFKNESFEVENKDGFSNLVSKSTDYLIKEGQSQLALKILNSIIFNTNCKNNIDDFLRKVFNEIFDSDFLDNQEKKKLTLKYLDCHSNNYKIYEKIMNSSDLFASQEMLTYFFKALQGCDNDIFKTQLLVGIADIFSRNNKDDFSLRYAIKAFDNIEQVSQSSNDYNSKIYLLAKIAEILYDNNKYDLSLVCVNKALDIVDQRSVREINSLKILKTKCLIEKDQFTEAFDLFANLVQQSSTDWISFHDLFEIAIKLTKSDIIEFGAFRESTIELIANLKNNEHYTIDNYFREKIINLKIQLNIEDGLKEDIEAFIDNGSYIDHQLAKRIFDYVDENLPELKESFNNKLAELHIDLSREPYNYSPKISEPLTEEELANSFREIMQFDEVDEWQDDDEEVGLAG